MKVGDTVGHIPLEEMRQGLSWALNVPEIRREIARAVVEEWNRDAFRVKCCVLPGGTMPVRQTDGAVGYDLHARAIVDAHSMDPDEPRLRRTLYDFQSTPEDWFTRNNVTDTGNGGYRLRPGESALVGVGVAFWMPPTLYQWVTPRSGLASKLHVTLGNAPRTIDSDYRGEAAVVVVNEGERDFVIHHGDRIAQMLFQPVVTPQIDIVNTLDALGNTDRGSGGFGSTGGFVAKQTVTK